MSKKHVLMALAIMALLILAPHALADVSTGGLPWEGPLKKLVDSLKGPIAVGIGVISFIMAGAMLAFGGEWGEVGKRASIIVLVVSVLLLAANFLPALFGTSGTLLSPELLLAGRA